MKNHKQTNKFPFIREKVVYDSHHDEYYIQKNGLIIMSQGEQLLTAKQYRKLVKKDKLFRMLR